MRSAGTGTPNTFIGDDFGGMTPMSDFKGTDGPVVVKARQLTEDLWDVWTMEIVPIKKDGDMSYDIKEIHFRDIYGRFLWSEPLGNEFRLYNPGDKFHDKDVNYVVVRSAVVDNTHHVNIEPDEIPVIVTEPHL